MDMDMNSTLQGIIAMMTGVFPLIVGYLIGTFVLFVGAVAGFQMYRDARHRRRQRRLHRRATVVSMARRRAQP